MGCKGRTMPYYGRKQKFILYLSMTKIDLHIHKCLHKGHKIQCCHKRWLTWENRIIGAITMMRILKAGPLLHGQTVCLSVMFISSLVFVADTMPRDVCHTSTLWPSPTPHRTHSCDEASLALSLSVCQLPGFSNESRQAFSETWYKTPHHFWLFVFWDFLCLLKCHVRQERNTGWWGKGGARGGITPPN